MQSRFYPLVALTLLMAASGCALSPGMPTPGIIGDKNASIQFAASSVVQGQVMAPAGVIAAGGGNVIAAGGGNLKTWKVLSATETPLAGTSVFLADASGEPLPGIDAVTTDDQGRYEFKDVPDDYTFLVVAKAKSAEGKAALLQTLAKASKSGTQADIDASSTVAAAAVVDGQDDLGDFDADNFKAAVAATAKAIKGGDMPDFTDRGKLVAAAAKLQNSVKELKSAIEKARLEIKNVKSSLATLKQKLEERQKAKTKVASPVGEKASPVLSPAKPKQTPEPPPSPAPKKVAPKAASNEKPTDKVGGNGADQGNGKSAGDAVVAANPQGVGNGKGAATSKSNGKDAKS